MFAMQSCTERFVPETETFEDLLVVEATITNELKKQEIKLTRTYTFEESQSTPVTNAEVTVSDNAGNQYDFQYQAGDSVYTSVTAFQAMPNVEYTLNITTNSGQTYVSSPEILPPANEVSINIDKKEVDSEYGVQISVDSYDPANSSHYYRYEYSETFKVIPPYWGPYKAIMLDSGFTTPKLNQYFPYVDFVLRDNPKTRVCYSTQHSTDIILTNTVGFSEDRVNNFPVRFIGQNNYMLTYKYSILIKQYVQNYESYIFYRTLKKISGADGTILSPNQPGFVAGNIYAPDNPDKKVVGFFDVSSFSSKRIFLQHETLFPGAPPPPYFMECEVYILDKKALNPMNPPMEGRFLRQAIATGSKLLYKVTDADNLYWMVEPECTDCTTFSSNVKPAFWE